VLLRLDGTQSRDDLGRLRAYVYLTESELLNETVARHGRGYADRRIRHTFSPQFEQAEAEARKHARGLWAVVTDDTQPAWRRAWLRTLPQR
jgi:endonuclease YncB( thermonuclease family)